MKNSLLLLLICFTLYACEDVIQLDVPTERPRLVIDASINWYKGMPANQQTILLSLTAPYFDTVIPPATGAVVQVTNSTGDVYHFTEQEAGSYKTNTFVPTLNETYTLSIQYEGDTYTATEKLLSVSPIAYVEQKLDGGFDGETTEIKAFYTDPSSEENYYLYEFNSETALVPTLEVYDDEFSNGNHIFAFYADEDLEPGQTLTIKSFGISAKFYAYMFVLLQQNSENDGGPFETQPAIVRGNCINTSNKNQFPLGYFRLSEADSLRYTIQ